MLEWRVLAPGTEDRNRGRHSSRKQVGGSVPSRQWGGRVGHRGAAHGAAGTLGPRTPGVRPQSAGTARQDFPTRWNVPDPRGGCRRVRLRLGQRRLPLTQHWRHRGQRPRPDGRSHTRPALRPPATSSPGRQLSHGEPDWGTGGDVRAQALLQNTDQENEVSAARGSSWRRSAAPPPTPHFTQTPSCSLSQHATRVQWRQPPRSLHGAEREEGPGARGLVERPSLGRGVRCARPCQLAGCTLSEYQHQEGHGTGPTFSAAPPETGHADVHTSQQQPPPMTQASQDRESGARVRLGQVDFRDEDLGPCAWPTGGSLPRSPRVPGPLPALACPPAGEAGPMSRRRPRDSRPCSRGPQRPRPPPRPRPGGSDVRCSRADLPPAV